MPVTSGTFSNVILSSLMTTLIFQICKIRGLQDVLLTAVPVSLSSSYQSPTQPRPRPHPGHRPQGRWHQMDIDMDAEFGGMYASQGHAGPVQPHERKLSKFLIMFDNSNLLYFPGQFLSGRVIVELVDEMAITGEIILRSVPLNILCSHKKCPSWIPDCFCDRCVCWGFERNSHCNSIHSDDKPSPAKDGRSLFGR